MRRIDDGHVPRPPPFRVLAASDSNFLSPPNAPPPPSRAPEPYKVAPSSTTFSRAHRRSSFVIIADSRPTTPESRTASPTLATGRVSPFRGRGFKGPPPKSKSRPQSPDPSDARRRGRSERRVSVSQQSSPRRSLIPQPTRQRSTSLTKPSDGPSSPKIGRRVDSRTRLNISESKSRLNSYSNNNSITNLATRRQSAKTSKVLSPIQGTPTKPEKSQLTRRDRSKETSKISPTKTPRLSRVPSRNTPNARKSVKEKNSSSDKTTNRDRLMSPSKIPLKSNRNGTSSLNPARFITISNQPGDKNGRGNVDRIFKDISDDNEEKKESTQRSKGKQSEESSKESTSDKNSSGADSKSAELDLINLLKQSSGATGTSSVVNTTATTAVQPLHIDANAVLVEKDLSEKKNVSEKMKNQSENSNGKSFNPSAPSSDSSASKSLQNSQNINDDQRSPNPQTSSKSSKPGSNYTRTRVPGDSRNDSPVPTDSVSGHSKNNSISQSVKNFNKINGTSNGTGSATMRSKNQNFSGNQTSKQTKTIEQKVSEDLSSVQTIPSNLTKASEVETETDSSKVTSNMETQRTVSSGNMTVKTMEVKVAPRSSNEGESKTTATTMTNSTSVSQVTTTSKANNVSGNNTTGAMNDLPNVNSAKTGARNDNRGSNVSLKSSAGMSVDSIESVRSTDTGVSVNTVRGVSSPREKTGMHVVKRAQEIETLSGNVVHLEQNGEPAVLAAANGVGERVPERLLTRWKRSLNRYCGCCPKMRCLACRTDPKGLAWPGTHGKKSKATTTVPKRIGNEPAPQPAADAARENAPSGCWSKLKNRCRCNRLKEMKCCAKRSRVAPAEVTPCCPPERRFGAICRRLFDRCKCKRAEVERRKSIRAKHSLTSVAPPPLSEEPKSKIPDVLVEHNSLMRGAIPCLPVPLAWFCLVWNILLPGSGTVWSGIFNLCTGQPRFSQVAGLKSRLGAFVVNLVVGVGQLFTVLFCLVGWGWSIWWGVTLVRLARKYKRFKASEAATNDPEARGGEPTALPPGVPSQALRGIERMR